VFAGLLGEAEGAVGRADEEILGLEMVGGGLDGFGRDGGGFGGLGRIEGAAV
jgi:hypothetical protein